MSFFARLLRGNFRVLATLSRKWRLPSQKWRVLSCRWWPRLADFSTLSRIPAPTPPDPERQGHLYFEAAPFACGSAMIFFKCRYLRHFCGATFGFSQHCRESGASLRKAACFIALLVTRAGRLLNTIAKVASSVPKVTRFIASLATRGARPKAKGHDRTQTLIWLVRISFSPVQLFADRGRDGQSAQVANLPRWPIRPHDQSAPMANPPDG